MKNKIHKILGVGLTLVIALALVAGFAVPVAGAETINEWYKFDYPVGGSAGDWFLQGPYADGERIQEVRELTEAINGDLYVFVDFWGDADFDDNVLKSEDGGRSWAATGYNEVDLDPGTTEIDPPGTVFDMVCSSIDEDIVYVTDGCYIYKTTDGGDTWDFVARDSLEAALGGDCGCNICSADWRVITCLDVTYDDDDNPFVYIGTREHDVSGGPCNVTLNPYPGDVFYIGEAGYPATWTSLNLPCFHGGGYDVLAIGCPPDWADSHETYVVITTDVEVDDSDEHTWVVYTTGTVCGWYEFAELLWDCETGNNFDSWAASRIAFPDDWEDTETLFVGVTDDCICCASSGSPDFGGDVYMVWQDYAQDANVKGIVTGCEGILAVDIISLDIEGDTDEARLIAGAFCDAHVYCSEDGGWSWEESAKDPTGTRWTYAIWYEDTALAATSGYECAVSMCCGEDYPCEFWNQISLIATDIDEVNYLGFSPGYVCEGSETMFMLTESERQRYSDSRSVFRDDGTYWERVFCSTLVTADEDPAFEMLLVSPDFNTTNAVFVANSGFEIWRSLDAGCSWTKLTFPCTPRPDIFSGVIIDEDTGLVGGWGSYAGLVYKTTRHGARPWDEYEVATTAGDIVSFDLEPGYDDPGTVLLGDSLSQVFISEDGGETWDLVGDCQTVLEGTDSWTYVVFDPAYATSGIIYAAAGNIVARCVTDPDEDWADQTWDEICDGIVEDAAGIAAAGDTVLYVTDDESTDDCAPNGDPCCGDGVADEGGVLRSLNPDTADAADVVFERIVDGLLVAGNDAALNNLWLTCDTSDDGCAENVLWSLEAWWAYPDYENVWVWEDTLAAPIVLDMPVDAQKLTTTTEATLSWDELCGADCYEVALWQYCPECPDDKLTIGLCLELACAPGECTVACGDPIAGCVDGCCPCTEDDCIVIENLEPGTKYYWKVRVCQGQPYLSKWSEERIFFTALPAVDELCSPICGGQDIILTTNFSWDAVPGATGYDIELATTETFTAGVVTGSSTVNAWVTEPLEYATTYYWRVRAEKDGVVSDWTVCIFTTLEAPVPAPPPVVVEPTPPAPVVPTPIIEFPPTPSWVWAIIGIGTALVVVVIVLTVRTRRPPA